MLQPRKTRFKKYHQKCYRVKETKSLFLSKGKCGVKAIQNKLLNAKQLEATRKNFSKKGNKNVKVWLNVFPHFSKTKKPLESRMGKGKGNIDSWYFNVKTGRILFEFDNFNENFLEKIKNTSLKKLPFKTKLIFKNFY